MNLFRLSKEDISFLQKYNMEGPRYTSYPTVPFWQGFDYNNPYVDNILNVASSGESISVYIHIPFCSKLCLYCACSMIVDVHRRHVKKYLEYLTKEIKLFYSVFGFKPLVSQMHWGGGTPTFLTENEIFSLYSTIRQCFNFKDDAEIAIEVDPSVTSLSKLTLLRELGFNRVSFGVQDFDPKIQKTVHRNQNLKETLDLIEHARNINYSSINIDLMYGLPFQTVDLFRSTIDSIIDINPDRIALFSYARVPWIKPHQKLLDDKNLPSAKEKLSIFSMARNEITGSSYIPIGLDHFAKIDDELAVAFYDKKLHRNFMGYTVMYTSNYVGFGISAIGYIGGAYFQNFKDLKQYYFTLDHDKMPVFRGFCLDSDDFIRQWVIYCIMCHFSVDYKDFRMKFAMDFNDYFEVEIHSLKTFVDDNLIRISDTGIKVLARGNLFIRNIAMVFDAYLKKDSLRNKFSKTI